MNQMSQYYKNKVKTVKNFVSYNELDINNLMKCWKEDQSFCLRVLDDYLTSEDIKYINNKLNLSHLKDNRTPTEYATELIISWIIEDGIVTIFNNMGFDAKLDSKDKDREFLTHPSSSADIKIGDRVCEIVKDYGGYWERNGTVELRDNKYNHLKNQYSILLGLDFRNSKFFLMNLDDTEAEYISYHYPFGKPAFSIGISEFYDFVAMKEILGGFLQ